VAASAESFDNCQSSSSIRSFRQFRIQCSPERIYGGPGANSFSPVSFREKLFLSVKKHLCCVLFRGTEHEHYPFFCPAYSCPDILRPWWNISPSVQDDPGCHLLPQLRNTQFWHSVAAQQGLSRKVPVYFTQAAFSIQAPITQREKNPCIQTSYDSPTISPFVIC